MKDDDSLVAKAEPNQNRSQIETGVKTLNPKANMNEITHSDTTAPKELSPEEMTALTGGSGFRYLPPDPC